MTENLPSMCETLSSISSTVKEEEEKEKEEKRRRTRRKLCANMILETTQSLN